MTLESHSIIRKTVAAAAIAFGVVTLIASSRILYLGSDPGYFVFFPLLIFNHLMGVFYVMAGYQIWRSKEKGQKFSLAIFLINFLVLFSIVFAYLMDIKIATESLGALSFRTIIWLLIYMSLKSTEKNEPSSFKGELL
ncbi:MAG: hypothetical protein ACQER4_05055 [Bacteroidota bacterium]